MRWSAAAAASFGALMLWAGAGAVRAGNDDWNATVATTSGADVADRVTVPAFPRAAQVTAQSKKAMAASPAPPSRLPQRRTVTKDGVPIGPSYPTVDDIVPPRAPVADASPAATGDAGVRFSAPSLMIMQHGPLPEGQWSTIVTGALGADGAPKRPISSGRQQFVEQEPEAAHPAAAPEAPVTAPAPPATAAPAPLPHSTAPTPSAAGPAKPEELAKPTPAEAHEATAPLPAELAKPPAPRTFAPLPPAPAASTTPPSPTPVPEARSAGAQPPPPAAQAPAQSAAQAPGAETKPGAPVGAQAAKQPAKPLESLPPNASLADQYCFNTIDTAADARFAWQAKKITDMEGELAKRVSLLEVKTEEFKAWLARRDEFSKKANEKLVGVYTRMKPDAAAQQLAAMDEEMAAAVLMKLNTKIASAVLGEMDTARAARLAAIISGAGKVPSERAKTAAQPGAGPTPAAIKSKGDGNAAAPAPAAGTKS